MKSSAPTIFCMCASTLMLVGFYCFDSNRLAVNAIFMLGMAILWRIDERTEK